MPIYSLTCRNESGQRIPWGFSYGRDADEAQLRAVRRHASPLASGKISDIQIAERVTRAAAKASGDERPDVSEGEGAAGNPVAAPFTAKNPCAVLDTPRDTATPLLSRSLSEALEQ